MKIACVDKTASDRLELQRLVVDTFDRSREAIGHLAALDFIPTTKEEILLGGLGLNTGSDDSEWSGIVLGAGYSIEEVFGTASEMRARSVSIPIFCFINPDNHSIRILRRVEKIAVEAFRTDDSSARIVHSILKAISKPSSRPNGKLVVLGGAKGGQGTSSIAVGVAHAAAAEGKSAIVIDLSKEGSLFHYLQSDKWQSSDYRTTLVDRITPSKTLLDRLIVETPNGVKLLLPPAGGAEIRDLWIRSSQSFEITLTIIEHLKERFDLVLIDLAHAEGLLPFSLVARADVRVVVASNEPAAVHLLNDRLSELKELPFSARTIVLLNMLVEHSLTSIDIEDFLRTHESVNLIEILSLPYDHSGANWIGTGNSLYTEGGFRLQSILRSLASALCQGSNLQFNAAVEEKKSALKLFERLIWRKKPKDSELPLLPAPEQIAGGEENVNFVLTDDFRNSFKSVSKLNKEKGRAFIDPLMGYQSPTSSKVRAAGG